jgi:hypothetical protein
LETKPRDCIKLSNLETIVVFVLLKETKRSDSNFNARELKPSKTELPIVLKLKKIKQKKHRAKSISSLKTINSKKQRIEKINRETIKTISNIKLKKNQQLQ